MLNIKTIIIILTCLLTAFMCVKKDAERTSEAEYEISGSLEGQTSQQQIDYDSLLTVLDGMLDSISDEPGNIELRRLITQTAYDSANDVIIAPGEGKPLQNAATPTIAMKYAEKAATIKAYRLAAQIKTWIHDPAASDSNRGSMQLPPGRVLSRKVTRDSTVQVLVEVNAADLK
jgi:hypothetical protein